MDASDAQPPLADVRVLAVEQFGAGPWATSHLADLGADVIKLEAPSTGGSLTGSGRTGPRAAQGAHDRVLQCLVGWMSITGEPGGPPTRTGLSLVDFASGYASALALTAGDVPQRRAESAHPSIVPFQAFQTADGWITVRRGRVRLSAPEQAATRLAPTIQETR